MLDFLLKASLLLSWLSLRIGGAVGDMVAIDLPAEVSSLHEGHWVAVCFLPVHSCSNKS